MVDVCDKYTAMFVTDRDERAAWIDKNLPHTVYERPENSERFYVRFGDDDEEMLYRMRWPLLSHYRSGIEYERGTQISFQIWQSWNDKEEPKWRIAERLEARAQQRKHEA